MVSDFELIQDSHLGRTNFFIHRIHFSPTDAKLTFSASYRAGPKVQGFGKYEIEEMGAEEVIKQAKSGWTAPIIFSPMKDGFFPLFFSYHKPNVVVRRHVHSFPRMNQLIDGVCKNTLISTLDANSRY